MDFEATIEAKKLKHAISVLRRVDDEAIFEIDGDGWSCRLVDAGNSIMAQVALPRAAFDLYTVEDMTIGIELDKLAGKVLKRAVAKDSIGIGGDEATWYFTRGLHRKSMGLLDPTRLRKPAPALELQPHTASMRFTGKEFKEIIAEAADIGDQVFVVAAPDGLKFDAISKALKADTYSCTLPADRYEHRVGKVSAIYTLEYLCDIAADMRASDDVMLRFGANLPCEIGYERDGVEVSYILAPRIESR